MFKLATVAVKLFLIMLVISACSAQKDITQNKGNPYLKLSTDEQKTVPETQIQEPNLQAEEIKEGQPNRPPLITEPKMEQNENITEAKHLPFQDFKEKWNAISDDQMSDLYIQQFDELNEQNETIYSSPLNKRHSISIYVQNGAIRKIIMSTDNATSTSTIYSMLSGWSQIIHMVHPDIEIYDVDDFFNQIGVGPNADLKNVKNSTIIYENIKYIITRTDTGYQFTAVLND